MPANPIVENSPEDTRQRIIAAALELFGKVGYAQTTTRAIAEAAGVNEVTLFRHFGSKKNLLFACVEARNAQGFSATFESGLTGKYPQDILHMAKLQMQDTSANVEMLRLLFCDARNIPELRDAMLTGSRSNLARLSRYFQRQIQGGAIQPGLNADLLAYTFDSLFSTNIIFEYLFQGSLSPAVAGDQALLPLVDLFVRGTWTGS
jgi:AcrR family transcriptional regulator